MSRRGAHSALHTCVDGTTAAWARGGCGPVAGARAGRGVRWEFFLSRGPCCRDRTAELDTQTRLTGSSSPSGQGLQVHYMYKTTPIHTPDLLMMTVSPT